MKISFTETFLLNFLNYISRFSQSLIKLSVEHKAITGDIFNPLWLKFNS